MYTDGLNEAENAQKEQFGNDRLQQLMADMRDLSSHVVIDRLKEAVEQHRNGTEPNDDLTLMCVRFK
jgi:Serine phosphatase RsbU, regulator of sigma subunit